MEQVQELARVDGTLCDLDQIYWNTALDTLRILARKHSLEKETIFFLEPMSGCLPEQRDIQALGKKYPTVLPRTVILLTEKPPEGRHWTDTLGCRFAVQSEYSDSFTSHAAFVILREEQTDGIETDEEKQEAVQQIVRGAEQRGQQILALNVRNEAAMCTLVLCGVTYVHGRLFSGNNCFS